MPDLSAYAKGVMGETAAENHLIAKGFSPIARRYRSPYGEIDLIMQNHDLLVFIEVKTRERGNLLSAQSAVTPAKQRRLISTARCFLNEHSEYAEYMIRFDVVTVAKDGIVHIADAFQGSEW